MADGSEMLSYLMYALLVIILAVAGWYIGKQWEYKEIGAVIGALIGLALAYGIHSYNSEGSTMSSMLY